MPIDAITGWPSDSEQDAPNGAAQMLRLVTAAAGANGEAMPVLRVRDAADRDAKYPTPIGLVVTTQAPWVIWLAAGTTWLEVYSDTGWVTTGFTYPNADWGPGSYMRARRIGTTVYLEGECSYTKATDLRGDGPTDANPGNVPNQTLVTIPPTFCPGGVNNGGVQMISNHAGCNGGIQLYPSGNVTLVTLTTSGRIAGGNDWARFSATYQGK